MWHDVVILIVEDLFQLRENEVSAQRRLNDGLLKNHAFVNGYRCGVCGPTIENQRRGLALGERGENGVLRQIEGGNLEFLEHDLAEFLSFESLIDRRFRHDHGMILRALLSITETIEGMRHDLFEKIPIVDHAIFQERLHVETRPWNTERIQIEEIFLLRTGIDLRFIHVHRRRWFVTRRHFADAHVTGEIILRRLFPGVTCTNGVRANVDHQCTDFITTCEERQSDEAKKIMKISP